MAYFDNAATTYPKPEAVYAFMDDFYRNCGGSAGRGSYDLSYNAKQLIDDTRRRVQTILNCPAKSVVFQPTATLALNIIIQGIVSKDIKNVYISPFEHNAVTRTLHNFEKTNQIRVFELSVTNHLQFDLERIKYQFEANKPDFVIVSHASNVIGLVAPVEDIFSLAKTHGAFTLVDMAQTAGLVDLNVGLETIDFAVFAGHKTLYGPMGMSGFVMKPDIKLPATLFGGTGYESANQDMPDDIPQRYEMGTLNIGGIAGLNAALRWIEEVSIEVIKKREDENRKKLIEILERYEFLTLIGIENNCEYVGVISAIMDGISSDSAGTIFSNYGISLRTGLQCAPLAHRFLGTYPAGTIRFSVSYFTTQEDFDELEKALMQIEEAL